MKRLALLIAILLTACGAPESVGRSEEHKQDKDADKDKPDGSVPLDVFPVLPDSSILPKDASGVVTPLDGGSASLDEADSGIPVDASMPIDSKEADSGADDAGPVNTCLTPGADCSTRNDSCCGVSVCVAPIGEQIGTCSGTHRP